MAMMQVVWVGGEIDDGDGTECVKKQKQQYRSSLRLFEPNARIPPQ
jgi:hypothetical protein